MNNLRKRIFFASLLCIGIYLMLSASYSSRYEQAAGIEKEKIQEKGLNLWYSNESFAEYLSGAALEYEKIHDVKINLNYVSSPEYLHDIARATVADENSAPDLYILREELLEEAFVHGITSNIDSSQLNEENFARAALDAVSYHDKLIAYPLSFHVPCLIYRPDIMEEPASLEQIMNYDIAPFIESGMEKSIDLNTGNILTDYAFIGKYVDVGGQTGDGQGQLNIDEGMFPQSVSFFQTLVANAGINPNAPEEAMILGYAEGKNLCLMLSSDYIALLNNYANQYGVAYSVVNVPKMNDFLECSTGSYTDGVVVNGMTGHQKEAEDFAEFLTCEYAAHLYEKTNLFPANYNAGKTIGNFDRIYDIYRGSNVFPKLLKTEDFNLKVRELFENATNGQDCMEISNRFAGSLRRRITEE